MTFSLEDAIILATNAHKGQTDKANEPYILHPLRVMFTFPPYMLRERITAVLHDTLEDTELTAESLFGHGVPAECVEAIVALTYSGPDKRSGMTYMEFVGRCRQNPIARQVKIADIKDNTSMERMLRLDTKTQERLRDKYAPALDLLLIGNVEI
jgi:GTP diphosphokinase / guanosine-3',5'-bis(diphosphate) 3'-diphosphatase